MVSECGSLVVSEQVEGKSEDWWCGRWNEVVCTLWRSI